MTASDIILLLLTAIAMESTKVTTSLEILSPSTIYTNADESGTGNWVFASVQWSRSYFQTLQVRLNIRDIPVANFGTAPSGRQQLTAIAFVDPNVTNTAHVFNLTLTELNGRLIACKIVLAVSTDLYVYQPKEGNGLVDSCLRVHQLGIEIGWETFPGSSGLTKRQTDENDLPAVDLEEEVALVKKTETRMVAYIIERRSGTTISLDDAVVAGIDLKIGNDSPVMLEFDFPSYQSRKYTLVGLTSGSRPVVAMTEVILKKKENLDMEDFEVSAAVSTDDYSSVLKIVLADVGELPTATFVVDMCWEDGKKQLLLPVGAPVDNVNKSIEFRLPAFLEGNPLTVYIRVSLRRVGLRPIEAPSGLSPVYHPPPYVGDSYRVKAFDLRYFVGAHVIQIYGLTSKCLDVGTNSTATLAECDGQSVNQRFFFDESTKQIRLGYTGLCLTRPLDDNNPVEFIRCNNADETYNKWEEARGSCGKKNCFSLSIPNTQLFLMYKQSSGHFRVGSLREASLFESPAFAATGNPVVFGNDFGLAREVCLIVTRDHALMEAFCDLADSKMNFLYDFNQTVLSYLAGPVCLVPMCLTPIFYEATTNQIVLDNGTCYSQASLDADTSTAPCVNSTIDPAIIQNRFVSVAFYGAQKQVRILRPSAERSWYASDDFIRGVILWDTGNLSVSLKTHILLVVNDSVGLSRMVIQSGASNIGYLVYEKSTQDVFSVRPFGQASTYQIDLTVAGEPPALSYPFQIRYIPSGYLQYNLAVTSSNFKFTYNIGKGSINPSHRITWSVKPDQNQGSVGFLDIFLHRSGTNETPSWTGTNAKNSIAQWVGLTKSPALSGYERVATQSECDCILLEEKISLSNPSSWKKEVFCNQSVADVITTEAASYYLVIVSEDTMQFAVQSVTVEIVETSTVVDSSPSPGPPRPTPSPPGGGGIGTVAIAVAASAGAVIVIAIVVIIVICVVKRKRNQSINIQKERVPTENCYSKETPRPFPRSEISLNDLRDDEVEPTFGYVDLIEIAAMTKGSKVAARVIRPEDLEVGKLLGEGEFGEVFQGVWKTVSQSGSSLNIDVAIKTLKQTVSGKVKNDLLKEASVMAAFSHPHLVGLMGVCLESPFRLVAELAQHGALEDYLRERSPDASRKTIDVVGLETQLKFAGQMADAMSYLEENKLVHRDVAARNVMVFSSDLVKVADFGLSRVLDGGRQYYVSSVSSGAKVALRWMAPECWNEFKFTSMSDVWSFGVAFWEIMSYSAAAPYKGVSNANVIALVEAGKRLPKPETCPESVFEIMNQCWKYKPSDRITFSQLKEKLWDGAKYESRQMNIGVGSFGPMLIGKDSLEFGKELGQGAFGTVNEATWNSPDGPVHVAVKQITDTSRDVQDALLKEASVMTSLKHVNIVQFWGICLPHATASKSDNVIMLVSELVPLGSLHSYVQNTFLKDFTLLSFAEQIALGMSYLYSQRVVHRDLAARNVLVSTAAVVKVCDFGMSKALGMNEEVYRFSSEEKVPVKWMSPEALLYGKFSTKSDIWSYGVTLWEMWCKGVMPWSGLSKKDLVSLLESGGRLSHPRNDYSEKICSEDVYQLMLSCWMFQPEDRPSFDEIGEKLRKLSELV